MDGSLTKFAGLEAEFQNTLSSDSGEARESVSDKVLLERIPELLSIAEVSPKAAIPHAWAQVEYSLIRTLSKLQGFVDKTMGYNISKQIEILHENGYLSKVDTQLLHELRGLRNKVSHHPEDTNSITFATAKDYSEKCAYFIGVFDDLLKKNG